MNTIDEIIENELITIKEKRAENRKNNRKPKYSSFAIKQLYNKECIIDKKNREGLFITKIVYEDKIYLNIIKLLRNSEYILNKSYLKKYIAKVSNCSPGTVHNKINELIELEVLENIDMSVRITRLFLRKVFEVDTKTINYKTDSKTRSKLMINRYDKGYRLKKQLSIEEASKMDLAKEKIIILNDREILLLHKDKVHLEGKIGKINDCMNYKRLEKEGINYYEERDKHWINIEKIYVISKRFANYKIGLVETEMLKDVIDFNEY